MLVYYCLSGPKGKNFGDHVTPYIYSKITGRPYPLPYRNKSTKKMVYFGAGSIMGACRGWNRVTIWGTGIIQANARFQRPTKVLAVRGPITRNRFLKLGYPCPKVYGDPGLLLPRFYSPTIPKKYDLGIIPHYVDYHKCVAMYGNLRNVLVINVDQNLEAVVNHILSCRNTVSSSLHGIIVSHAYQIPCGWIRFSDKIRGGNTKFWDYYGSVGGTYFQPLTLTVKVDPKRLIAYSSRTFNPKFPINTDAIMAVCPFKKSILSVRKLAGTTLPIKKKVLAKKV